MEEQYSNTADQQVSSNPPPIHPLVRRVSLTDNSHGRDGVSSLVHDYVWIGEHLLILHAMFHASDINAEFSFGLLAEGLNATDIKINLLPTVGMDKPKNCTVSGALEYRGSSFLTSQIYIPSLISSDDTPKYFYYVSMQIRLLIPATV